MADRYILESSAGAMSVGDLIHALHISAKHGMAALGDHYSAVLAQRLGPHTFQQVRHRHNYELGIL